jgi:hypothetical protein
MAAGISPTTSTELPLLSPLFGFLDCFMPLCSIIYLPYDNYLEGRETAPGIGVNMSGSWSGVSAVGPARALEDDLADPRWALRPRAVRRPYAGAAA